MNYLQFEVIPDGSATINQLESQISGHAAKLSGSPKVEVEKETTTRLTGAELAAFIGVSILVVKGGRELAEQLRLWIPEIKAWIAELKGLKDILIEIGPGKKSITALTEEDLQELAEAHK